MAERTREYVERFNEHDDILRVRYATERGVLTRFMVQYEVRIDQHCYPAVRYDSAHGVPHRDTLDWTGRTIAKAWFPGKSYTDVFREARSPPRHPERSRGIWRCPRPSFSRGRCLDKLGMTGGEQSRLRRRP